MTIPTIHFNYYIGLKQLYSMAGVDLSPLPQKGNGLIKTNERKDQP